MNKTVLILTAKNRLHLFVGSIRQAWATALGLVIVFGIFLYQLLFSIMQVERGVPIADQYIVYIFGFIAAVNFIRIFISKTPVFKMNAATLHYLYNTKYFNQALHGKYIFSAIGAIVVSFLISFCINGFVLNLGFVWTFVILAIYLFSSSLMAWIHYHGKKLECIILLPFFAAATALVFTRTPVSALLAVVILILLAVYSLRYLELNIPKYYNRLYMLDTISAAQSQNNMAKMEQLAAENRPQIIHGFSLRNLPLSKRTALISKSLIELIRMQKQILVLLLLLLLAGWLIGRTVLFDFIPLLDVPEIRKMLAAVCTATALSALYQLFIKQISTVIEKQKMGLFLPYPKGQVLLSYLPVPAVLNLFLSILLGALYSRFSLITFIFWIITVAVYSIQSYVEVYGIKAKQLITGCTNLALWAGTYWYIIM